jgi:hypothetical protein
VLSVEIISYMKEIGGALGILILLHSHTTDLRRRSSVIRGTTFRLSMEMLARSISNACHFQITVGILSIFGMIAASLG